MQYPCKMKIFEIASHIFAPMNKNWLKVVQKDPSLFEQRAMEVFRQQYATNEVYRSFAQALGIEFVQQMNQIPFLPVEFFKNHPIICGNASPEIIFESSSTTGNIPSKHLVKSADLYQVSFLESFNIFYGSPADYRILALLPSYLERKGSSLVYMMDRLIKESGHPESGFYLHNLSELASTISKLEKQGVKSLLLGVSFALLDFAEAFPMPLKNTIIMETGGMKGKREEITREELHRVLKEAFSLQKIHSEYGMTELLSQAYSTGNGIFRCPPWMKVVVRDPYDPFHFLPAGSTGVINIIDLANYWSCSFLATSDLGRSFEDGSFEVLGRMDHAELRGCNLMVL